MLDYYEYRNFIPVIEKAKEACNNSGHEVDDHFVDIHEMVQIGSGAMRSELREHNKQLIETAQTSGVVKWSAKTGQKKRKK